MCVVVEIFVPKPERDNCDIHARLEQVHRGCVPDRVRRDCTVGELRLVARRVVDGQCKALRNAGPRQLSARAAREQEVRFACFRKLAYPLLDGCRRRLPKRNTSPFPALSVQMRHRRHVKHDVANAQVDGLRHARASIVDYTEKVQSRCPTQLRRSGAAMIASISGRVRKPSTALSCRFVGIAKLCSMVASAVRS